MAVRAEIFDEQEKWKSPLAASAALHIGLAVLLVVGGWFQFHTGTEWGGGTGGGGEAMSATLVSSVPLPRPPTETQNVLATENKGLSQTEPKTKEEPLPDAIPIPDKTTQRKPWEKAPTQRNPRPTATPVQQARNIVPYGEGGPVSGPYSMGNSFSMGNAKGGLLFGGGGDFGSRFSWYVDNVRRKVSENWMKYEIDPSSSAGRKTFLTFDINRDGSPANVRVEQSSGVPSLDISAVRALQRIDTFGPLPPGYSGNKVSVEFWFQR